MTQARLSVITGQGGRATIHHLITTSHKPINYSEGDIRGGENFFLRDVWSLTHAHNKGHVGVGTREVRGGNESGVVVLGAGRGVQAGEVEVCVPAMAAEAGRETRQGARAMRRATDATGHKIASAYGYATQHTKPQGFIISPPAPTFKFSAQPGFSYEASIFYGRSCLIAELRRLSAGLTRR
jgi:hypothetical protein